MEDKEENCKLEKQALFSGLYAATKEAIEWAKKPLVEKQIKRKFQSAKDSAENQKIDSEMALNKLQENIKEYDLNKYLELLAKIKSADITIEAISKHYLEMFGEELK